MIKACVIGFPIKHSRSPMIHGHWLKLFGIEGEYGRVEVRPEELREFLGTLPERGYAGCNITLPTRSRLQLRAEPRRQGQAHRLDQHRLCA